MSSSKLVGWLDQTLYPEYRQNWDDERLRAAILPKLKPEMKVLDLGAGAGLVKQMNFRGLVRKVVGIDPDPRVHANPFLDEAYEGYADRLPFPEATFDVVYCDNVLEHLREPGPVFQEVARVLKPGGAFFAKTPNASHYMPLIARATPISFHRFINRRRGRASADTFPTFYRANTPGAIRNLAASAGLRVRGLQLIEGRPEYLRFNPITYICGWLYERAVNSTSLLARFRVVLLIELYKPMA